MEIGEVEIDPDSRVRGLGAKIGNNPQLGSSLDRALTGGWDWGAGMAERESPPFPKTEGTWGRRWPRQVAPTCRWHRRRGYVGQREREVGDRRAGSLGRWPAWAVGRSAGPGGEGGGRGNGGEVGCPVGLSSCLSSFPFPFFPFSLFLFG